MNLYHYAFYCLYRIDRLIKPQWLSHWKASIGLLVIELWLLFPIIGLFYVCFDVDILPETPYDWKLMLILLLLIVIKERVFFHNDTWKEIVKKYDALPRRKNNWGMLFFVLFVVALFVCIGFSFYLIGKKSGTIA
jgi:hypothetical protein